MILLTWKRLKKKEKLNKVHKTVVKNSNDVDK